MTGQVQDHGNPSFWIHFNLHQHNEQSIQFVGKDIISDYLNKRPMGHIAHLRNKFKSVTI